MASIDERIVSIQFDNSGFERKIGDTIASLDRLTQSIQLVGAAQGFDAVTEAADRFDTSNMASAVENIASKFTALGAIAFSVIQKITQDVLGFVQSTVQEDILGPIITGGRKRALNIEQAKFQFRGLGVDVQQGMDSALAAVKNTAFGLDEAAKAASQLSASGIQTGDEMTGILRGIAGTAAMTGSSFSEMADIFTASAGSGKVNTQDLLQFSTRGLNAAAALAKQMGLTEAQVRDMASEGKLDFKTFADAMNGAFGAHATKANETYEGSLANLHAAMSRLGASIFGTRLEQQRDIFNSLTPVIDNVSAALKPVIQAFLDITSVGTFRLVDFFNNLDLSQFTWAMPAFAEGVKNAFTAFGQFFGAIKAAFRDIFPPQTVSLWVTISQVFLKFTEHLKMGGETIDKFKSIFRGLFSIIEIGWTVFKELIRLVKDLIGAILPAGGGALDFAAKMGELAARLNNFLVAGGKIHDFFEGLRDAIKQPIPFIDNLRDKIISIKDTIVEFFQGLSLGGAGGAIEAPLGRVDSRLDQIRDTANKVSDAWDRLKERFKDVFTVFDKIFDYIKTWFGELGSKIAAAFKPGDFNAAVDIVNVGLVGGIFFMLRKFINEGFPVDITGGLLNKVKDLLDTVKGQVVDTFSAVQTKLKAEALMKIAIAIGILTASLVILSLIDSVALTKALTATAVGFGQLAATMILVDKFVGDGTKFAVLAGSMIAVSIAMAILSIAIANLGRLDWNQLTKGLIGIGIGLFILVKGINAITVDVAGLIRAGIAMVIISAGLWVLSKAVESFATMSWGDLVKGLVGVGIGLGLITIALNSMPAGGVLSGLGFIEVAVGLNILGAALKIFASMSWGDMAKGMVAVWIGLGLIAAALNAMPAAGAIAGLGFIEVAIGLNILGSALLVFATISWGDMIKGLVGIGLGLVIIAGAMQLMPVTLPITAFGLILVADAMVVLAGVLRVIGAMDLGSLVKGLVGFAGMLIILTLAVNGMTGALPGALALVVVAGAMTILAAVLEKIGSMSIEQLIIGLAGIAATLIILGVAALVMQPIIPALLALGAALAVVGIAFSLFGVGAYLIARAFQTMAESGVAGAKAIVESIDIMVAAIPKIATAFALTIIGTAEELLKAMPLLIRILEAVLEQLLDTIIKLAPKLAKAIGIVLSEVFKLIQEHVPEYVQTGFIILMAFLRGIRDNIKEIVIVVAEIITEFINGLTEKIPEFVDAVFNFILTLATEVARKIGEAQWAFIPIGIAFMDGFLSGLTSGAEQIYNFFRELPGRVIDIIKELLGIDSPSTVFAGLGTDVIQGFINGLNNMIGWVWGFFTGLPGNIISWVGDMIGTLWQKGKDVITGFLWAVAEKEVEVMNWFKELPGKIPGWIGDAVRWLWQKGIDVINGFWSGMKETMGNVVNWFWELPGRVKDALFDAASWLWQKGQDIIHGLWKGIEDAKDWLVDKAKGIAGWVTNPVGKALEALSPSRVFMRIGNDVIAGLVIGLGDKQSDVEKSSTALGESIINGFNGDMVAQALTDSMSKIPDILAGMDELNPVITPVLDLTKVQEESGNLEKLMRLSPIPPDVSLDRARLVSATAALATETATPPYTGPTEVTFEQNIYAPTALTTNDIYRNTKSQLALAKEKLGIK